MGNVEFNQVMYNFSTNPTLVHDDSDIYAFILRGNKQAIEMMASLKEKEQNKN